jgi:hypothetical protein
VVREHGRARVRPRSARSARRRAARVGAAAAARRAAAPAVRGGRRAGRGRAVRGRGARARGERERGEDRREEPRSEAKGAGRHGGEHTAAPGAGPADVHARSVPRLEPAAARPTPRRSRDDWHARGAIARNSCAPAGAEEQPCRSSAPIVSSTSSRDPRRGRSRRRRARDRPSDGRALRPRRLTLSGPGPKLSRPSAPLATGLHVPSPGPSAEPPLGSAPNPLREASS